MLVAIIQRMQNKGLDRIIKFNYKKFKSTFLILSFLFSIFGDESNGSTPLTTFNDGNNGSNPLTTFGDENISNSGSTALDDSVNLSWVAQKTNADYRACFLLRKQAFLF